MLRFLSQRKRSQKLIWVVVSVIVVFGMVAFYSTPGRRLGRLGTVHGAVDESDLVAKVGRKDITAHEYISSLDAMLQAYQGILSRRGGGSSTTDYNTLK